MSLLAIFYVLLALNTGIAAEITSITPSTPFPGDKINVEIAIINPGTDPLNIDEVTVYGNGMKVLTPSIKNMGTIPPGESLNLNLIFQAEKEGFFAPLIIIRSDDSIAKLQPQISVDSTPPGIIIPGTIKLGEMNNISFTIFNPRGGTIRNVIIDIIGENAMVSPASFYFGDIQPYSSVSGHLTCYFTQPGKLIFKITFYSDSTKREIEIQPELRFSESKGVKIDVPGKIKIRKYDTGMLNITVANLRDDSIYNLTLSIEGSVDFREIYIPELKPSEFRPETVEFVPYTSGEYTIYVLYSYEDFFGTKKTGKIPVKLIVDENPVIGVSGVEVKIENSEVRIVGDVINTGKNPVLGVTVEGNYGEETKSYFIGRIDPSDFNSFELTFSKNNASEILLNIRFTDSLNKIREINHSIPVPPPPVTGKKEFSKTYTVAGVVSAVIVFLAVGLSWKRRKRL